MINTLDDKTLEKLADLICGDKLAEKYCNNDYSDCPFYRKGSELPEFFRSAGLKCHDFTNESRKQWVLTHLQVHNRTTFILCILLRLANPIEYGDQQRTEIIIEELNRILAFEGLTAKLDGAEPKLIKGDAYVPIKKPEFNFIPKPDFNSFIDDEDLSKILNSRWDEVEKNINSEAYLSSIILMGSILEGTLLSVVEKNPKYANLSKSAPKNSSGILKFKSWSLNDLLNVAHDCEWIDKDVKDFNVKLRDYRNLVHPRKQRDEGFFPDEDTCKICLEVVKAALNDINNNCS